MTTFQDRVKQQQENLTKEKRQQKLVRASKVLEQERRQEEKVKTERTHEEEPDKPFKLLHRSGQYKKALTYSTSPELTSALMILGNRGPISQRYDKWWKKLFPPSIRPQINCVREIFSGSNQGGSVSIHGVGIIVSIPAFGYDEGPNPRLNRSVYCEFWVQESRNTQKDPLPNLVMGLQRRYSEIDSWGHSLHRVNTFEDMLNALARAVAGDDSYICSGRNDSYSTVPDKHGLFE